MNREQPKARKVTLALITPSGKVIPLVDNSKGIRKGDLNAALREVELEEAVDEIRMRIINGIRRWDKKRKALLKCRK